MPEEEEQVRITDKRGQNKSTPPPTEVPKEPVLTPEELAARMAEQGLAAEQEDAQQPGFQCATFVILTLDRLGNMRLWRSAAEITALQSGGFGIDRDATGNDIINMTAQLELVVKGNEYASRVVQGLAAQAQMAAQQRGMPMPVNGLGGVDPRVHRAAHGGG